MIKNLFHKFQKERDLTVGSISKNIWILAIPMLVSNLLQAAFNLVDMIWVGKLGPEALAAVSMSGSILMVLMFLMIGLGVGTTALIARAIGEKDNAKADNIAMQSLIMGAIGSFVFGVIGYFLAPWLLQVLGAQPAVLVLGIGYMRILFVGVLVTFYLFLVSAILQGAGDAATPMLILVLSTLVNIVLDPLLIFGLGPFPKMGVNGAALGTVIAECLGSAVALDVLLRGRSRVHVKLQYLKLDLVKMWNILKIGVPASFQMTLRGLVGIVLIAIVAGFGTTAVAAFGVGMRLHMLAMMPGFALGMAAATLVGQNLGAKQPARAVASAWWAVFYYGSFMLVMALSYIFFAPHIIMFFNDNVEVIRVGSHFLKVSAFGYLFIALGVVLSRSLVGAGDTVAPLVITFFALWVFQIPLAIWLAKTFGLGGIWYAFLVAYIVQGTLSVIWFQLGRWKRKKI